MSVESERRTVRAIVCEDEPLARRAMEEYLADVAWLEVVDVAANGKEALRLIHKHEPDLVFLDVRMPGMDGLAVLDALQHDPAVVFTTAFDEYAVSAFDHGAVDYLVKPFGRERLLQTLDRVRARLAAERSPLASGADAGDAVGSGSKPTAQRLFARHRGAVVPISVDRITRLEAVPGGVDVHCDGRALFLDSSLAEVEARLDPTDFVRVHRGHVVNLSRVRSIRKYDERRLSLLLEDGSTLVASRAGSQALRSLME